MVIQLEFDEINENGKVFLGIHDLNWIMINQTPQPDDRHFLEMLLINSDFNS